MVSSYKKAYRSLSKVKAMGGSIDGCCPTLLASDYKGPQCVWILTPIDNGKGSYGCPKGQDVHWSATAF